MTIQNSQKIDFMKGFFRKSREVQKTNTVQTVTKSITYLSYFTNSEHKAKVYKQRHFEGACIDAGAAKSVCGVEQAKVYCEQAGQPWRLKPSTAAFRLRGKMHASKGVLNERTLKLTLYSLKLRSMFSMPMFHYFWV